MDGQNSQIAQILVPLAVAAGSAVSPYVARGIGPGLAALGAVTGLQNQKARNSLYQSQAKQEELKAQDLQAQIEANKGVAAEGANIRQKLQQGTPIPGTQASEERGYGPRGKSLAEFLGREPSNEPLPPQEIPTGAIATGPAEASMIRGTSYFDPIKAMSMAAQTAHPPPSFAEAAKQLANMPPGSKLEDVRVAEGKASFQGQNEKGPKYRFNFSTRSDPKTGLPMNVADTWDESQQDEKGGPLYLGQQVLGPGDPGADHVTSFVDENGNQTMVGVNPRTRKQTFRFSVGKVRTTSEKDKERLATAQQVMAMRAQGLNVDIPEIQKLTPQQANSILQATNSTAQLLQLFGITPPPAGAPGAPPPAPVPGAAPAAPANAPTPKPKTAEELWRDKYGMNPPRK